MKWLKHFLNLPTITNMKTKLCTVRKDILERNERVPIGNISYGEVSPLKYRWLNDEEFQVFYMGKYRSAQSIDFDFEIEVKTSQYQLLLEIQSIAEINIVTCGNCSAVILHRCDDEKIECYDCNYVSEPCDFPDLFHEELSNTKQS